ncbi:MAG: ABC transporter permease [Galactobacter sp.]
MTKTTRLPWLAGMGTIFTMEFRQRLRSRGFYWILGVWFVVILAITLGVGASMGPAYGTDHNGQLQFELVLITVLILGSLVAPAFAANSISGDRAGGTLAVVQSTLVTPGQIMTGKWLAAWVSSLGFLVVSIPSLAIAAFQPGLQWGPSLLMLAAVALELAILTWIGVGVSAWTSRPIFAILSTYLLVAFLGIGTLIATGIAATTITTTVRESEQRPTPEAERIQEEWDGEGDWPEGADDYFCSSEVDTYQAPAIQAFTWLLAANPVVLVADLGAPTTHTVRSIEDGWVSDNVEYDVAPLTVVRYEVRSMQAGPQAQVICLEGKIRPSADLAEQPPVWPIGLAAQLVLTGFVVIMGRRKLVTPTKRLGVGTRVA